MSPPCVAAIFEGDNGGATATGVSPTEIRVAVPHINGSNIGQRQPVIAALFEFFNRTFELYGRRLVPVFVPGNLADPASSRALASEAAAKGVFGAITGYAEWDDAEQALFQELARQRVVTVARGNGMSDRIMLDELHPYLWTVEPSTEQWQTNVAAFACTALAGRDAKYAMSPSLHNQRRKFGVIAAGEYQPPPSQTIVSALRDCGQEPALITYTSRSGADLRTALAAFKAAGVTTVACVCNGSQASSIYGTTAAVTNFGPEFLIPTITEPNDEFFQYESYRGALFGVTARPRVRPMQAQGWFQALQIVDPGIFTRDRYYAASSSQSVYEQLLVLAAGIQAAGPQLTPETFAAGLMTTPFSNAAAGQPPYWQPSVGFGAGDHSFIDDYAVAWWSDAAPALDPQSSRPQGSWCYVTEGARYRIGTYPSTIADHLFEAAVPCR